MVNYRGVAVAGSPFGCKVYDCKAIKVKNVEKGVVGKPVTFVGKFIDLELLFFLRGRNLNLVLIFQWKRVKQVQAIWK
jgi:hypothetical protein